MTKKATTKKTATKVAKPEVVVVPVKMSAAERKAHLAQVRADKAKQDAIELKKEAKKQAKIDAKAKAEKADKTLSSAETKKRKSLENAVRNGRKSFVAVGAALAEIRSSRLYRDKYNNWDDYCSVVFDMSRVRSTQLISASNLHTALAAEGFKRLPMTESQCRPFSKVPKEGADETNSLIWSKIESLPKDTNITAKLIASTVASVLGIPETVSAPRVPTGDTADTTTDSAPTDDKDQALEAMRETIRSLKAKVAHLESSLQAEKTAHARTKSMSGHGVAVPTSKVAKDMYAAGYKAMAKTVHPDNGGDAAAMAELNTVFTTLNNA